MDLLIQDLVKLSAYSAQHPRLVQGGGGNCSVKTDKIMAIKASGFFLEELTLEKGYSLIDLITHQITGPSNKPSLEAPLHRLLGTYVIHSHALALGAFVCSREGKNELAHLFPKSNCVWTPYADPGRAIHDLMKQTIQEKELNMKESLVFFLENHGLFVSSPDKEECLRLHEETVQKLERFLELSSYDFPECNASDKNYLTPDHAVYLNQGDIDKLSPKQRIAVRELQIFTSGVLHMIKKMHWTPQFLSQETAQRLLNMEEEKYRQRMLSKEKP